MRRGLPALAIVAAVLWTAGCGGGSSNAGTNGGSAHSAASATATVAAASATESSGSVASVPVSGSVTRADAICKRLIAELRRQEPNSNAQVAQIANRRTTIEQAALTELRKVTPPASIARDYHMLLADRQTLIEETAKLAGAIVAKDKQTAAQVFTSSGVVLNRMKDVAGRSGFKYCGVIG